ncbi:vacuolar-sorting protein SNF8-like [Clytia hemisphaerica]|uniref:vacuolar-sorting protein SNF8-like n=1 Tax=Clytia hemisphaerica TaxID=252671 RepID=UPI0034D464FA
MRRGPGLAAVDRNKVAKQRFAAKGTELADAEISQMVKQLDSFKNFLESFAAKHQADIKKNPEFRQHFQKLCSQIGVDPLASSKGFWAEILGVGDFYYELGVQITEVCLATKANNGGLISLDDLLRLVLKGRGRTRQDVSEDDVTRAIKKLSILGSGFQVLPLQGRKLVQSVPSELNKDHTEILQLAENSGYTTESQIQQKLGWQKERTTRSLNHLIHEGMVWIDKQDATETLYWVPGYFPEET